MDELLDKIKKIEALIVGAKTEGEKTAALMAKERINRKILDQQPLEKVEFTLYTPDSWHKKLLIAICRKHGVRPYRYKRQKYTTVMVKVNERFLNKTIWKEYLEYSGLLEKLVFDITDGLIEKIYKDEGEEVIHGNLK